ncbi:uncharacterized protein F5891DRAFT_975363 [Suillus fuscotomentosus]|uniref:Transposase n=1 Tax=Suillus fuscotomentosus TaxID=1912939 RepID=A0AAD4EI60_9AGAM|nr:uncharacterized protein F5891DRAFT_975363 [Suillus fuscotomentosus]KAG1906590.1 hypothetical protein F5891DRAFT_975363 [Suillus fuscotomentosus]
MFQKLQNKEDSREDVLRTVAEFVVCDDQSLIIADKPAFRNCLVVMQPNAILADIPSTHDVLAYIHNAFIEFIKGLKATTTGLVSTTTDLWSVDQTKATFLGLMAHWIEANASDCLSVQELSMSNQASNNNITCDIIEMLFHCRHIYNFNTTQQYLPCLAHMVNLAITDIMSVITYITNIETTTTIWEIDPLLPNNHVLGDLLDIVAVVHTLAIKI